MPSYESPPETEAQPGLVAVLADCDAAVRAARNLIDAGVQADRLGLIGKDIEAVRKRLAASGVPITAPGGQPVALADRLEPPGRDAAVGAALGAAVGLAVGLGPLLIPLFGPWLLAYSGLTVASDALFTSVVGSGLGAFLGRVFEREVEDRHLARWYHALDTGGWLLVVRGDGTTVAAAQRILEELPAAHLDVLAA